MSSASLSRGPGADGNVCILGRPFLAVNKFFKNFCTFFFDLQHFHEIGAPGETRTRNLRSLSPLLC